ncbi:hypothetical protein AB0J63_26885 [Streptosporangium canum]|uniref:tyrosine-type recombinase/integrase n=1 Tax=Streptosporangium canum TaxID=324952 RepID=UPI00342B78E7
MAYAYTRDKIVNVRYKKADGKWGNKSRNPDTGRRFVSEREAEKWGEEQEIKERLGLVPQPAADDGMTVSEWFQRWWPSQDLGLRSRGNYAYLFTNYILTEWGAWRLKDITASAVNAWEQRLISSGYERDGVPAGARTKLGTFLGDAVIEGLIPSNPALRQRNRGRRSGVGTGGRGEEKVWPSPTQALLVAERLGVLSGRDDEFILGVLLAWTGLRWGEVMGLQPQYVKLGQMRVDWQMVEVGGKFYLLPPKDDSNRPIDLPPFLAELLGRQLQARPDQKCMCKPVAVEGQEEQPCQGGGRFVFLGPKRSHMRNSNFARRFMDPAADGAYPQEKGTVRPKPRRPVLVNLGEGTVWPGQVWPMWSAVVAGRGAKVYDPNAEGLAVAEWLPIVAGLTPHGLRHGHSTWMADLGTHEKLRDERMGHVTPGMRGVYTHVSPEARKKLMGGLQEVWETALAERAGHGLRSPVKALDELLAPFRTGRHRPVSPVARLAEITQFPATKVG